MLEIALAHEGNDGNCVQGATARVSGTAVLYVVRLSRIREANFRTKYYASRLTDTVLFGLPINTSRYDTRKINVAPTKLPNPQPK